MAGAAPTGFHFARSINAGPVHCSVWLCARPRCRQAFFRLGHELLQDASAMSSLDLPAHDLVVRLRVLDQLP